MYQDLSLLPRYDLRLRPVWLFCLSYGSTASSFCFLQESEHWEVQSLVCEVKATWSESSFSCPSVRTNLILYISLPVSCVI